MPDGHGPNARVGLWSCCVVSVVLAALKNEDADRPPPDPFNVLQRSRVDEPSHRGDRHGFRVGCSARHHGYAAIPVADLCVRVGFQVVHPGRSSSLAEVCAADGDCALEGQPEQRRAPNSTGSRARRGEEDHRQSHEQLRGGERSSCGTQDRLVHPPNRPREEPGAGAGACERPKRTLKRIRLMMLVAKLGGQIAHLHAWCQDGKAALEVARRSPGRGPQGLPRTTLHAPLRWADPPRWSIDAGGRDRR